MNVTDRFSSSYAEARRTFRAAADLAGTTVAAYQNPAPPPGAAIDMLGHTLSGVARS